MALRKHFSLTASTHASTTITALEDLTTDNTDVAIYEVEQHTIRRPIRSVTVINHGAAAAYYRFDGTAPTDGGGDDDWVVPANGGVRVHSPLNRDSIQLVFISSGTPAISVIGE